MALDRRLGIVVTGLGLVLAVMLYREWSDPSATPLLSSNGSAGPAGRSTRGVPQPAMSAPDVHLKELDMERPTPTLADRNLFLFKTKPIPVPAGPPPQNAPAAPTTASNGPAPPPAPPPIPLKFIGLIGPTAEVPKIAVFSDGRGAPQSGKEGDIILGQFRIVHIGTESIELSYLDGRGRQTIRLTGS